jgi:hypothetical protein
MISHGDGGSVVCMVVKSSSNSIAEKGGELEFGTC